MCKAQELQRMINVADSTIQALNHGKGLFGNDTNRHAVSSLPTASGELVIKAISAHAPNLNLKQLQEKLDQLV